MCDIFSNFFQLLKKRRRTMKDWDEEFFESLIKKRRCRSIRLELFCKKGVLRNFAKFTGKHLRQSLLFNKVVGLRHLSYRRTLFLLSNSGGCFQKNILHLSFTCQPIQSRCLSIGLHLNRYSPNYIIKTQFCS